MGAFFLNFLTMLRPGRRGRGGGNQWKTAATFVRGETRSSHLPAEHARIKNQESFPVQKPKPFAKIIFVVVLKKHPGLCLCSAGGVSLPAGFAAIPPRSRRRRLKGRSCPHMAPRSPSLPPTASPEALAKAGLGCGSHRLVCNPRATSHLPRA